MNSINSSSLKNSLKMNWKWFRESGVMNPPDGLWGVAERVLLTKNNSTCRKTLDAFPAWTPFREHCIIEQRRADCNLECAYLFFLLNRTFGDEIYLKTAENIIEFLYFRSGLLNRTGTETILGTWDWSHIRRKHQIYFDDNAWMLFLALKIARRRPGLDRKYDMKKWALTLAGLMADALPRSLEGTALPDRDNNFSWLGKPELPHWGSLVCMALAEAFRANRDEKYIKVVADYEDFIMKRLSTLTVSELGYALLGCTTAAFGMKRRESLENAREFADKIVRLIDPETGNLPSEHYEAPSGKQLADTVYTLNWAVLGLQNMAAFDKKYKEPCEKILALIIKIQDRAPQKHLRGCWRGMFDLEKNVWGGGDKYEGGASSIYTGWTNAPISWAVAFSLSNSCLMKD